MPTIVRSNEAGLTDSYVVSAPGFESTLQYQATCLALLLWWLGFLYPIVSINDIVGNLMTASASTEQGSLYNQLLISTFAVIGLLYWPHTGRLLRSRQGVTLMVFLLAYCAWSVSTLLWSDDRSLSLRRLASFLLILTGCWGLGAGFYARTQLGVLTFARHVIWGSGICVLFLFGLRIVNGSLLDFLNPEWTLKYTTQIESYAFPVGYAIVAMLVVLQGSVFKRWAATGFYFGVLVLLKGRTLIMDVLAVAALVYSRLIVSALLRVSALVLGCMLTVPLIDLATGGSIVLAAVSGFYDVVAAWVPYISIGEGLRNLTTLSGRVPLWRMVRRYIADNPYFGHGFGAFWNPERFAEAHGQTKWYAVVAHNGFLDELLATGAVGLTLFLAFWLYGMVISLRAGRVFRMGTGYMVFGWLLLFLLFNVMDSIMQSYFMLPTLVSLIGLFALLQEYACDRCPDCNRKLPHTERYEGELL